MRWRRHYGLLVSLSTQIPLLTMIHIHHLRITQRIRANVSSAWSYRR